MPFAEGQYGGACSVMIPSRSTSTWRARSEVKIFPQGGHCFTQVMPRDFNQAVLRFLKAHTPA